MPGTRSYGDILKDVNECLEILNDEWERVQTKRLKGKNEEFRKLMKERMDLIVRVHWKLQRGKRLLITRHQTYRNSPERQRAKEEMEDRLSDLQWFFSSFSQF